MFSLQHEYMNLDTKLLTLTQDKYCSRSIHTLFSSEGWTTWSYFQFYEDLDIFLHEHKTNISPYFWHRSNHPDGWTTFKRLRDIARSIHIIYRIQIKTSTMFLFEVRLQITLAQDKYWTSSLVPFQTYSVFNTRVDIARLTHKSKEIQLYCYMIFIIPLRLQIIEVGNTLALLNL